MAEQGTERSSGANRENDFEQPHDLGSLRGTVAYSPAASIILDENASFRDVFTAMEAGHSEVTGIVLFVDKEGKFSGLLTYRDLTMLLLSIQLDELAFPHSTKSAKCTTLDEGSTVSDLLRNMSAHVVGYRHLPVINSDGKPIGVYLVRQSLLIARPYLAKQLAEETVADLDYTKLDDNLVAIKNCSFSKLVDKLNASGKRVVLIQSRGKGLTGIVTEWDVICKFFRTDLELELASVTAEDLMTPSPTTCSPTDNLLAVSDRVNNSRHHQLPVVNAESSEVIGVLFARDIVDTVVEECLQNEVLCSSPSTGVASEQDGA